MKIAQIATLHSPDYSGVLSVVMNLSSHLKVLGNEVDILAVDTANNFPRIENVAGVTIKRFKAKSIFKRVVPYREFSLFLKNNLREYDVIHVHGYGALPCLLAAHVLQRYKGTKVIVFTPHYHTTSGRVNNILKLIYDFGWLNNLKIFAKIIFVSKSERDLFFKRFGEQEKSSVVYNGVNLKLIQEAKPFENDDSIIMYVGGLRTYKNIDNIVRTMTFMPEKYKLVIIGSGPQEPALREMTARIGLTNRIQILSNVSTPDLYRWYKTCRVLVNLSEYEAFGIVLIEALAAGKRVVCSDIPSFKEIASEFDGIHPVAEFGHNPELLAKIIQQIALLSSPVSNNLQRLDWVNLAREVNSMYCELDGEIKYGGSKYECF